MSVEIGKKNQSTGNETVEKAIIMYINSMFIIFLSFERPAVFSDSVKSGCNFLRIAHPQTQF